MQLSENTDKLFKALTAFQKDCPKVTYDSSVSVRTRSGGSYSFEYATLRNIIDTTREALADNGLSVIQFATSGGVQTMIAHESGQYLLSDKLFVKPIPSFDKDNNEIPPTAQELGSAITYAKRYQLSAILRVDADKDDDGNVATGNTATHNKTTAPKKNTASKSSPKKEEKEAPKQEVSDGFQKYLDDLNNAKTEKEAVAAFTGAMNNGFKEEAMANRETFMATINKLKGK